MSIQFWGTVRPHAGDMGCGFDKQSGEHVISLISPNAREIVERSEEGLRLNRPVYVNRCLWEEVCQLRVSESTNTAQRFLSCPFDWEMKISDVGSTGHRSELIMRQLAFRDNDLPPCFDWWINRHTSHLPLSIVIKSNGGLVNLSADRYGDSLVSLTLDGLTALHNIQISGPLASVRTLRLIGVEMVTADDLVRFPKLERLYVTQRADSSTETRVDFGASQTSQGSNALTPWVHLQHLFINYCSHVRLPELPMLFPHLQSLSLRGSNLGSPLHFPPKMPQLTHLDLLVQNPKRIRQLPHCQSLRFLALHTLDTAVLRNILHGNKFLRHLEGRIKSVASFDITSWEPFIDVLEVLHITGSPQLRNLVFPKRDSLLHPSSLDINGNSQLITLDISGCVNLTELVCCSCPQLREVVGLAGLEELRKAHVYQNPQLATIDVSCCASLTDLRCHHCEGLSTIFGVTDLGRLETLHVHKNPQLTTLDVSSCLNLTHLDFHECRQLREVVGLQSLSKLQVLSAGGCDTMTMLDVSSYKNLRQLFCEACPQLRNLVGLAGSHSLCVLHVSQNPQLTALDVSSCVNLTNLQFDRCRGLQKVVGVAGLAKLEKLHAYESPELTSLNVSGCISLKEIMCYKCAELTGIIGLTGLDKLETLLACENPRLTSLDVSGCVSLKQLRCYGCVSLTEVVGLAGLRQLERLLVYANPKLTNLDVSGCIDLTDLQFDRCRGLQKVAGVAGLAKLEKLHAHQNPKLTTLDVSGCVSLRELTCYGCPQLRNVAGLDENPALKESVLGQISHGGGGWCSLQ